MSDIPERYTEKDFEIFKEADELIEEIHRILADDMYMIISVSVKSLTQIEEAEKKSGQEVLDELLRNHMYYGMCGSMFTGMIEHDEEDEKTDEEVGISPFFIEGSLHGDDWNDDYTEDSYNMDINDDEDPKIDLWDLYEE